MNRDDAVTAVAEALLSAGDDTALGAWIVAALEPYIAARIAAETEALNLAIGWWAEKWLTTQTETESLREENRNLQRAVSAAENRWRAASETDAVKALHECVHGSYEYGTQDEEFVAAYVTPTGPIHRAITTLQAHGIVARPKAQEAMPTTLAERVETDASRILARVIDTHDLYFDRSRPPIDACPEPEDVWRYERDFRTAVNPEDTDA